MLMAGAMAAGICAIGDNGYTDRTCSAGTPTPIPEGSKWGYTTASGKRIPAKFDVCGYFFRGTASVCTRDRCGWIDEKGRFIAPPYPRNRDWRVSAYSDGLAAVQGSNCLVWRIVDIRSTGKSQVTCINMRGKQVSPTKCVERDYPAGLRPVEIDGRWGYRNIRGKLVIRPQFEGASDFYEGLAAVRVDKKEGFIDLHGTFVIAPQFAGTMPFCGGLSQVFVDPDPIAYFRTE